ncbi:Glycosyl hydrolases family 43 [compost metagenome]
MITTLHNGQVWHDTNCQPIHAHGGHMLWHEGYYYWYGEDRREDFYISCYRSRDLMNWEFRSHIITTTTPAASIRVRTNLQLRNDDGGKINLERPKVLYNESTGRFVLWVHYENGKHYGAAACAIASSTQPDSEFVYHGSFNPFGYMSRDCTLFQDDNGTAYFISAARENADLHIYRLADDYMNVDTLVHKLWQGEYREAPAVFKREGVYSMLSSFCTGWDPNQGKYGTATSIEGDWSRLSDFGDATTFDTQPAFVVQHPSGQWLYYGDRWNGKQYDKSGYVVLPIDFEGDTPKLAYYDTVELSEAAGTISAMPLIFK